MAASRSQTLLDTKRNTIFSCKILYSVLLLVFAVSLVSFFVLVPDQLLQPRVTQSDQSISLHLCNRAPNQEECSKFVSEVSASNTVAEKDGKILLQKFLMNYARQLDNGIIAAKGTNNRINGNYNGLGPVEDCMELLDLCVDRVRDSVTALSQPRSQSLADVRTWLSSVLTNHVTCIDGLNNHNSNNISRTRTLLGNVTEELIARARTSLAMLAEISSSAGAPPDEEMLLPSKKKFPSWVTKKDRKLLDSSLEGIKADLVVARDGTGNYSSIGEAISAAPNRSKRRFVIYVKLGTYEEHVEVFKKKNNLMIVGDGMDLTIITGSLSVDGGSTTYNSATFAAVAEGFILQDICIQNTAGPEKHQAVALRIGGDKTVVNRCRLDAYQDTLYVHSERQYYRDCLISGTIDFIFGNAAVVIQNSKLVAKKPMKSQKNMVTAQGRVDPNQNTGISIHGCEIVPSEDLRPEQSSFPSYLGRPWKEYARVAVMQSYIADHIDAAGWYMWNGDFALKTCYFGEYINNGPGACTCNRVDWPGHHTITDPAEAMKFTVAELIQGKEWLENTGVNYEEGLLAN